MTKEISKNLVCILIRGGVEKWVERDIVKKLTALLKTPDCPQFIEYQGELINKADITGVFTAETMEERTKSKNGQWKCKYGQWHDRFEKCIEQCSINKILNS